MLPSFLRHSIRRKYRIKPKRKEVPTNSRYCSDCNKFGFFTKDAARQHLSNQFGKGKMVEKDSFTCRPYFCPHGFFHIGRNWKTVKLLTDFMERRTSHHSGTLTDTNKNLPSASFLAE
jgi:hypothetical protein